MKHILLLEDDAGVVDLLQIILEEAGYYVTTTARVNDAKQMLERCKVDLFIADILLPDGVAFPAIDEAKSRNIPSLLMTGSLHHMAQLKANGELHLAKPFGLKDFTDLILERIGPGDGHN
jgi:DNA-binding response OmpR family regulator